MTVRPNSIRGIIYKYSFFPFKIFEWNKLDLEIRKTAVLEINYQKLVFLTQYITI